MTMEITDSVISPSDPYPEAVSSEITVVDEPPVVPVVEGRRRSSTRGIKPARNGEGIKEVGSMVGGGRNVDVMCVYASNPYHQCSGYCSQRNPASRRRTARSKSESMVGVKMGEKKKVDPRCINADNPYHKCSKNCSQKSHKKGLVDRPKSEESGTVKRVDTRNVNVKCGYARNPYHTCTEFCLQRIQKSI